MDILNKIKLVVALLICVCVVAIQTTAGAEAYNAWEKLSSGLGESEIHIIRENPLESNNIFAGSLKRLYKLNQDQTFVSLFSVSGKNASLNDVFILAAYPQHIFLATDKGLFESDDNGLSFKRIYYSSNKSEGRCLSVLATIENIYLGTAKGLYMKSQYKGQWQRIPAFIDDDPVYQILDSSQFIYFITHKEIFRLSKDLYEVKKIFAVTKTQSTLIDQEAELIHYDKFILHVSQMDEERLILATTDGFYVTQNYGVDWERYNNGQVPFEKINSIIPSRYENSACDESSGTCFSLYVATDTGVYFVQDGRSIALYKGMDSSEVNDLMVSKNRSLYAATTQGVYVRPINSDFTLLDGSDQRSKVKVSYKEMKSIFNHEPTIQEVHGLAVSYAEVHPQKIKEWRRLALKKAWIPSVDMGIDGGRGWSKSDSIWGSSSSGGLHYVGPDDKSYSQDIGWDVSLSWDLADLVWSTDQTTIDSRSKLMVELREDILNQVTRIYFERRRLQIDLLYEQHNMDKQMRVDELTALIDVYTGGEFTERVGLIERSDNDD